MNNSLQKNKSNKKKSSVMKGRKLRYDALKRYLYISLIINLLLIVWLFIAYHGRSAEVEQNNTSETTMVSISEESEKQDVQTVDDKEKNSGLKSETEGSQETENKSDQNQDAEKTTLNKNDQKKADDLILSGSDDPEIQKRIDQMTIEDKVAQLFIITPEQLTEYQSVTAAGDASREAYNSFPVGGIIYFEQNLTDPQQVKDMLGSMKQYSWERTDLPLFTCVDEEGGNTTRIACNEAFGVEDVGPMLNIGNSGDSSQAYRAGQTIGSYLSDLGFNVDFAPVADVIDAENYSVIGDRSFGSDSDLVAEMVIQELNGLKQEGIIGTVKHFPGEGSIEDDTHNDNAYSNRTMTDLENRDLVPFQKAVDNGVQMIMVGHVSFPNITGDDQISSLSSVIMTDLLRKKMGYNGLILTDALNMGAIQENYDSAQAALMAIQAGCDILLMPEDFSAAYQSVLKAVKSGVIDESRLDESLQRILTVKLNMN